MSLPFGINYFLKSLFLLVQAFPVFVFAQTCVIQGRVQSESGEPLPFASIRVQGQNKGTLADAEGNFRLDTELGKFELEFRFVGYQALVQSTSCPAKTQLIIQLKEQEYSLEETFVTSDGRDPAYGIIRKAIDRRKYHLSRPKAYSCEVYIKGLQRLNAFPERILGMKVSLDSSDLGIVYLSESVSQLNLRKPKDIREIMISSKVSGRNNAFSYNQASDILIDYYESLINVYELSERGFISPISPSSFLYYQFKLLGKFTENAETVYRIQVIPKRNSDPVFSGEIFIAAPSYRIHSTQLFLTKESGIEFVDTLQIEQLFVPIQDSLWMPASQRLEFAFSAMGFRGNGHFVTNFMNYGIDPEFPKGFFSKEILKVEEGANKRSQAYWDSIRPTPLTQEEIEDYFKKDSIATLKEQPEYLDSLDRARNKFDPFSYLVSGHSWSRRKKKLNYLISPLLEGVQFNTVEGLVLFNSFTALKNFEKGKSLNSTLDIRYGFSSGKPFFSESLSWRAHGPTMTVFTLVGGRWIQQFDSSNPVPSLPNTLYTLLDETNHLKLFEKQFVRLQAQRELFNGFRVWFKTEYARRLALVNSSDYTIRDVKDRVFSSNNPLDASGNTLAFEPHNAWSIELNAKIVFANEYSSRPDRKINNGSKWPFLNLMLKAGIPLAGATTQFVESSLSVQDDWNLEMLGKSSWRIRGGYFFDNTNLYFMDYRHFGGNLLILRISGDLSFQGLPYYEYSTDSKYASGHFVHHFGGWFINKVPLIRKLKLGEYAGLNTLYVPGKLPYTEYIFGLERLGLEIGGVVSYSGSRLSYAGFRLGTSL